MDFTVEVTTAPVLDDEWAKHLRAVDNVPGTLLLQDADEPMLVFPVEAATPMKAAQFVDGVATLLGLNLIAGKIMPAPDDDFEACPEDDEEGEAPLVAELNNWVEASESFADARPGARRMVDA